MTDCPHSEAIYWVSPYPKIARRYRILSVEYVVDITHGERVGCGEPVVRKAALRFINKKVDRVVCVGEEELPAALQAY